MGALLSSSQNCKYVSDLDLCYGNHSKLDKIRVKCRLHANGEPSNATLHLRPHLHIDPQKARYLKFFGW